MYKGISWCRNLLGEHPEIFYFAGLECDTFRTSFLESKSARSDDNIFILDIAMERLAA